MFKVPQEQVSIYVDILIAQTPFHTLIQLAPLTGKTTMLASIICRYILASKDLSNSRTLLVSAPTNKAVSVIASKFLRCIQNDDSIKVALIGDKAELLADNEEELGKHFVYTYTDQMASHLRRRLKKFDKVEDLQRLSFDTMSKLRQRVPDISRFELEKAFQDIAFCIEKNAEEKEMKKAINKAVGIVRNMDQQQVVKGLLETADVIFCTLSTSGNMDMTRNAKASDIIIDEASASTEAEVLIPL